MDSHVAKKLEAKDFIKLYGVIQYQWDLKKDHIDWQGPIDKLLSLEIPLVSGSSFNNILDSTNFWLRLKALTQASIENPSFSVTYNLNLPNYDHCGVEDTGKILYSDDGTPSKIDGQLKFLVNEAEVPLSPSLSGYDTLTGFSEKEVSLETLMSYLDQSQVSGVPGAYIALTIDELTFFACQNGLKSTERLIKETTEAIRNTIRFNDFMGKTSCCCFGIILKDCDRWGIIRAADRLILATKNMNIKTESGKDVKISISLGGIVFPSESLDASKIMQKAERYLFEAQSIKGRNVIGTPYGIRTEPDLERPANDQAHSKRRSRDLSNPSQTMPQVAHL